MTPMRIILEGDGSMPELQGKTIHRATVDAVTWLWNPGEFAEPEEPEVDRPKLRIV